ncbi:MAG: hypothetical protein H7A46_18850 [Verrucomicrobiales bacterium]|nr:hypothetical protein [Verrucomicrobiales bacterium]
MSAPAFVSRTPGAAAWGSLVAALAAISLLSALPVRAEPLTGGSFVLVGAPATGGSSEGGTFRITGYVAAAGANTSVGEGFGLTCGLLGLYASPGDPVTLKSQVTGAGTVRLWWKADATGYQLEGTAQLGSRADWQPVSPAPAGNEYFPDSSLPARFYRLRWDP